MAKKRSAFPDTEAAQQKRARQALTLARRAARALLEFHTPAGILADGFETDIDPFLQAVEKVAKCFEGLIDGEPLDMEAMIMSALRADAGDERVTKVLGHHHDLDLVNTLGAFALGVACGQQGGVR